MDKGTMINDISDARHMQDMNDATGEILVFLKRGIYNEEKAKVTACNFSA